MQFFEDLKIWWHVKQVKRQVKRQANRKHQYDPITEARMEEQRRCWVNTRKIIEKMEADHRQECRSLCNDISKCLKALDRAGIEWPIKAPQVEKPKGWMQ